MLQNSYVYDVLSQRGKISDRVIDREHFKFLDPKMSQKDSLNFKDFSKKYPEKAKEMEEYLKEFPKSPPLPGQGKDSTLQMNMAVEGGGRGPPNYEPQFENKLSSSIDSFINEANHEILKIIELTVVKFSVSLL